MDCERRRVGDDGVLSTTTRILDLPSHILIEILSSASIPVSERVRSSRTCEAFYHALSGPDAFSDVKELPGPEISRKQFDEILGSEKDSNTRSAMVKRLRRNVTSLVVDVDLKLSKTLSELLKFLSAFEMLTELRIVFLADIEADLSTVQVPPHLLQVSLLSLTSNTAYISLTPLLNQLGCIMDFSAVTRLELDGFIDHTVLQKLDFKNLEWLSLDLKDCKSSVLAELLQKNVESLKVVCLYGGHGELQGDPTSFLSALCQLHLQDLILPVVHSLNDRWFIELAANSGDTLVWLAFQPASDHALDFIQQRRFKKLTLLELSGRPQCLTSIIAFIEGRPDGLPKMTLRCEAVRQDNETEEQEEQLRNLIASESDKLGFMVQGLFMAGQDNEEEDELEEQ